MWLSIMYVKKEFVNIMFTVGLCSGFFFFFFWGGGTDFFQTLYDDKHQETQQFCASLNDLDLYSRSR